jgi:hypothetical protein
VGAYEHFGSATDVVDYETEITAFFLTGEVTPNEDWSLSAQGTVTRSKGSFASPVVELPEETVAIGDYDYTEIPAYSRLDFRQIELTCEATRRISSGASAFVGAGWYDLIDDAAWVYGDMSGTVLYTRAGIETRF